MAVEFRLFLLSSIISNLGFGQVVEAQRVLFVNHASSSYDMSYSTREGVVRAYRLARVDPGVTIVGAYNSETRPLYDESYVKREENDAWFVSETGPHTLQFPQAKQIYYAGGYLSLCLCESVRDTVRNSKQSPLKLTLLSDAVYGLTARSNQYSSEYLDEQVATLETIAGHMDKATITKYLRSLFFKVDGNLCRENANSSYYDKDFGLGARIYFYDGEKEEYIAGVGARKVVIDIQTSSQAFNAKPPPSTSSGPIIDSRETSLPMQLNGIEEEIFKEHAHED